MEVIGVELVSMKGPVAAGLGERCAAAPEGIAVMNDTESRAAVDARSSRRTPGRHDT
jgi:hypothetical protein